MIVVRALARSDLKYSQLFPSQSLGPVVSVRPREMSVL